MLKSLLSRVTSPITPRPIGVGLISGADGERLMIELEDRPRVALVTDKAVRQRDPEAPSLEELGYGIYDREITMRASYYARRPWLWLLRAGVRIRNAAWRLLNATHGRLWHTPPHRDGCGFRWRDVRPGSGALETARAATTAWRRKANKLQNEVDELKGRGRRDYVRGLKDGWDQHQRTLENIFENAFGIEVMADESLGGETDDEV